MEDHDRIEHHYGRLAWYIRTGDDQNAKAVLANMLDDQDPVTPEQVRNSPVFAALSPEAREVVARNAAPKQTVDLMNPYVVLFNPYGTGVLGDAVVYGPFAELEDAERYAEELRVSLPLADRDRLDIEIEPIQSPPALKLGPRVGIVRSSELGDDWRPSTHLPKPE